MTEQEYQKISDIFIEIRQLPEPNRAAALDALCGSNAERRAHVEKMLEADRRATNEEFLGRSGMEDIAVAMAGDNINLPPSGTVIGKYRLGRRIGAGGMGVVYEAQDLSLDRRVAVKVLAPGFAEHLEERLQRFQREARSAAQLTHPHIAAIYDAGTDNGYSYIAMEFVEGRTLRALITQGKELPDLTNVVELVGQIVSALSAAHEAGIVHRDIKPENIMIRPDGFVKVLDFGLASVRERRNGTSSNLLSRPGQVAGTIQYLSPEQVLGQTADARSDLFSAGVVAYELATGIQPFDGATDGAIFDAILHHNPKPPSQVRPSLNRDFDDLVLQALQKDKELRFQSSAEFRNSCLRLSRLTTPASGIAIPAAAAPAPDHQLRPWKVWTLAMSAGVICLAAAIAWAVFRPSPPVQVTRIVQITRSDERVDHFVADGPRIIYAAGPENASIRMFQVSATGGEPVPLPRMNGMFPLDVSPDRSQLLLGQHTEVGRIGPYPLWIASALGDSPRRLGGGLVGKFAHWSPAGDKIAYSEQGTLEVVRSDGSEPRSVVHVTGYIEDAAWSRDSRFLRFTVSLSNSRHIWEVGSDGTGLHMLSPNVRWQEMGAWTPDARFFLFSAGEASHDLWISPERVLPFAHWDMPPVRLTNGPFWAYQPQPDSDGHRVYFLAESNIGQLVLFDQATKHWNPFLGGMDAVQIDYSTDGKWIAYADSNGCIWRSAADGSQRIQLTVPPLYARNPRWSPDGQSVLFYAAEVGHPDAVYVTPSAGGALTRLAPQGKAAASDGTWSSDGSEVIYETVSGTPDRTRYLMRMQVRTKEAQPLPDTLHLWSPRWSPDGALGGGSRSILSPGPLRHRDSQPQTTDALCGRLPDVVARQPLHLFRKQLVLHLVSCVSVHWPRPTARHSERLENIHQQRGLGGYDSRREADFSARG